MAKLSAKQKKKRRRKALNIFILLIFLTGLVLSFTVFFEIEAIEVTGETMYGSEVVVRSSGIKVGDNMFRFFKSSKEEAIETKLPYIDEAVIHRKLPSTIVIELTPSVEAGAIQFDGGYAIFSKTDKVLCIESAPPDDVPVILGVTLAKCSVGESLATEDSTSQTTMLSIAAYLSDYGFIEKTDIIDVSDHLELAFVYDDRVLVTVGTSADIEYKLQMFSEVMTNRCDEDFFGYIDVSTAGKATVGANSGILDEHYPDFYSAIS